MDLYEAIRLLRPAWHDDDDDAGALKIVMTGSAADKPELGYGPHVRTKGSRMNKGMKPVASASAFQRRSKRSYPATISIIPA